LLATPGAPAAGGGGTGNANCCQGNVQAPTIAVAAKAMATRHMPVIGNMHLHAWLQLGLNDHYC
jgi:hypothetical protein